MTVNGPATSSPDPARRLLLKAAAWSIPVVVLATSTPAAASSVPPTGTVNEISVTWDPVLNSGDAQFQLNPSPGPDLSSTYVTYDDPSMSTYNLGYLDDGATFGFTFESNAQPPNQFTLTISIPGYLPKVVTILAPG